MEGCVGVFKKNKEDAVLLTHILKGGLLDGFVQWNNITGEWVPSRGDKNAF